MRKIQTKDLKQGVVGRIPTTDPPRGFETRSACAVDRRQKGMNVVMEFMTEPFLAGGSGITLTVRPQAFV